MKHNKMVTDAYGATKIRTEHKREKDYRNYTDKEEVDKCLACTKPECTNCLAYHNV